MCRDGDPVCDQDDVDGQCSFAVQLCPLVTDPRLAACAARRVPVGGIDVRVRGGRTPSERAQDRTLAGDIQQALLALPGASPDGSCTAAGSCGAAFDPPLPIDGLSPACSDRTTVPVAIAGARRSGSRRIEAVVEDAAGRQLARTSLRLRCLTSDARFASR